MYSNKPDFHLRQPKEQTKDSKPTQKVSKDTRTYKCRHLRSGRNNMDNMKRFQPSHK